MADSRTALRLDAEHTRQLLQQAPSAYRTQVNDLLLTALARVMCRWSGADCGADPAGRPWPRRPVRRRRPDPHRRLVHQPVPAARLSRQPGRRDSIKAIKEQLRAVPHKGLGYGVLRYLADARRQRSPWPRCRRRDHLQLPRPVRSHSFDAAAALSPPPEEQPARPMTPTRRWPTGLSVEGQVYGGELVLRWSFSRDVCSTPTIQRLGRGLPGRTAQPDRHCLATSRVACTPSDFPLARLTQHATGRACPCAARVIADIYPLSPMQQGMLLHTLLDPGTGLYFMQDRYSIIAPMDPERFTRPGERVAPRHAAAHLVQPRPSAKMLQMCTRQVHQREVSWTGAHTPEAAGGRRACRRCSRASATRVQCLLDRAA